MNNSTFVRLLIAVLVLLIFLAAGVPVSAAPVERVNTTVTDFTIHKYDGSTATGFQIWERLKLAVAWDASVYENQLHTGEYFVLTLPTDMRFPSESAATHFNILAPDGVTVMAAAVVTPAAAGGGTVQVTFTDYVENKFNVKGTLWLEATFNRDTVTPGGSHTFTLSVGSSFTSTAVTIYAPEVITDETIVKWGEALDNPEQVLWVIRLNHRQASFTNVVLSDSLSSATGDLTGLAYLPDSFRLRTVVYDAYGNVSEILSETGITVQLNADNTAFTYNLGTISGASYQLLYTSTYRPGLTLSNKATLTATDFTASDQSSYTSAASGGEGEASLLGKIRIRKVDAADAARLLPNAVFRVTRTATGETFDLTTGANGEVMSGTLVPGAYTVREITAPVGYVLSETVHDLTVNVDQASLLTVANSLETIDLAGRKTWSDGDNQDGIRPAQITVNLLKNGQTVQSKTVSAADGWAWTFTGLPRYENGSQISYTLGEEPISGYVTSVQGDTITNTHVPATRSVDVQKVWHDRDNQMKIRPAGVTVTLWADGAATDRQLTLSADNAWTGAFTGLAQYKGGQAIQYTVRETAVADHTTVVSGNMTDGFVVTNTIFPHLVKSAPPTPTPAPTTVTPTPVPTQAPAVTPAPTVPPSTPALPVTGEAAGTFNLLAGGVLLGLAGLLKKTGKNR